jgi:hypothetical protein
MVNAVDFGWFGEIDVIEENECRWSGKEMETRVWEETAE